MDSGAVREARGDAHSIPAPDVAFAIIDGKHMSGSKVCSEDGCDERVRARGLCINCYSRRRKAGMGKVYRTRRDVPPCAFATCMRPAHVKGLCASHYMQQWHGRPLTPIRERHDYQQDTLEGRLLERREIDAESGCWLWRGTIAPNGYGQLSHGAVPYIVHRAAYDIWVGPINGDVIHHKCHVKHCFNPDHLEAATQRENILEMIEREALRRRIRELEDRLALYEPAA